jgi:formylmethanofuran--tetrahydromethanopterin N-formyltransferase
MLELNGVTIDDTFAEAFPMSGTRVVITAESARWAGVAATQMTGCATSVIACDCEAGIERELPAEETPDGRPGLAVLVFAFNRDALGKAVANRVGQCVLTCPTTACYGGIVDCPKEKRIAVGGAIRFFGDGWQSSKKLGTRRFWRLPTMDGEFVCEDKFGTVTGVGGGNLLLCGVDQAQTLAAAEAAAAAMRDVRDVILPFPGGIVRSGSKVGSRYKKLKASTNDPYCPTLRPMTDAAVPDGCHAVYELVVDGLSFDAVQQALRAGLQAACQVAGLKHVTAGNYGGKLGKHHFHMRELLPS